MKFETVIRGGRLVYPEATILADVAIAGKTIQKIGEPGQLRGEQTLDADGCYVLPGVIDPHTHPVYLDSISGLSKTAAFGGVTTVIHYAYAKPGQSLIDVIEQYKEEGNSTSAIDFALHGGLFETIKQADEIPEAFKRGVSSFKMFVAYAKLGWMTDDYALVKAMDIIGRLRGLAAVHAENGLAIDYIQDKMLAEKADFASRFLETSPDLAEAEAIFRAVYLGKLMNCPVYIPHISSAEGVEAIRYLKQRGMHVYAETCPQYLSLTWDELKSRGALGKVGPAIKQPSDQDALWSALREGLFDTLGSDHAPKDKSPDEDFFKAAYGSPEVETMLPVVWHQGVNRGRVTPNDLIRLFAENPARITGLFPRKGRLDVGSDADIVIFDPSEAWSVTHSTQHSSARYSLFEGKKLMGRVKKVLSRGRLIVEGDTFHGKPGDGTFLPTRAGNWPYSP
jgi:dihydropyrimidinase